jgi:sugar/nucleoside kinase (ribokinase family)
MIVAFGNPVYDYIQTPVISTGERVLSGCSTNACLALQRLGHETALVGRIGDDYRDRFVNDARRYGVAVHVKPCEQTGGFQLVYNDRGERTLDVLGVAAPIEHGVEYCADAQAIIIGPIMQETTVALVERIHQASDAPLILDPQGLLRQMNNDGRIEHILPASFEHLVPLFHVIKANELEAQIITGINPRENGRAAARRLKELGCTIAIVTLAEAGSIIDDGRQQYVIPPFVTDARDPTGAGDTYMAGFLHAYMQNPRDLYASGCYGSATASIWIEHTGPDAPVTLPEVERRAALLLSQEGK